jgi:hypothetical protein
VPTPAAKWCPVGGSVDIAVYFHPSIPHSILNKDYAAFSAAIQEWNLENLGTGYHLVDMGACSGPCDGEGDGDFPARGIVIKLAPLGIATCTGIGGRTTLIPGDRAPGAVIDPIVKAYVRLNSQMDWSANDRLTTARHELGHALGMGHLDGCPTTLLMTEGRPCGTSYTLDSSTSSGIACLYGTSEGDCASRRGVRVVVRIPDVRFFLESCPCGAGCAAAAKPARAPTAVTYELAINENGGPYAVFTNLDDSDWVNGSYDFTFPRSYSQALIRMRVFENGVFTEESYSLEPVDIVVATDVPAGVSAVAATRIFPNPLSPATYLEFGLADESAVEVSVYDPAGRRVMTSNFGTLAAGAHRIPLDRRTLEKNGARSGVYFYTLRIGSRTERGKLLLIR